MSRFWALPCESATTNSDAPADLAAAMAVSDLARHPLARLAVLEAGRPELRGLHHARDPFHVCGNEDLQRLGGRLSRQVRRGGKAGQNSQHDGERTPHAADILTCSRGK